MPLAWAPASILELRMVLGGVWRRGPGWLPGPAGSLPCGRSRVLSRSPRYLEVVLPLRAFLCKCFLASVENKSCCRPAAFLAPPLVLLVVPSSGLCVCVCPLPVGPALQLEARSLWGRTSLSSLVGGLQPFLRCLLPFLVAGGQRYSILHFYVNLGPLSF